MVRSILTTAIGASELICLSSSAVFKRRNGNILADIFLVYYMPGYTHSIFYVRSKMLDHPGVHMQVSQCLCFMVVVFDVANTIDIGGISRTMWSRISVCLTAYCPFSRPFTDYFYLKKIVQRTRYVVCYQGSLEISLFGTTRDHSRYAMARL